MHPSFPSRRYAARLFLTTALLAVGAAAQAQTPPAPGESPRIDAIRKAGVLRVGVVNNPPWLVQN
ncbi:MAG: ABC transporter substrate-binding protein, partial [Achromobacter pestifer]